MPSFTVAIWETDAVRWGKLPFDLRIRKTLKAVRKAIAHHQATHGANEGVFVAREYLFDTPLDGSGSLGPGVPKQLTGTYYAGQIIKEMRSVTRGSNLLVIPGTIAQRDVATSTSKRETLDQIRKHYNAVRLAKNMVYGLYQHDLLVEQTEVMRVLVDALTKMPVDGKAALVRNTAHGFLGGEQVLTYHKRAELGEVLPGSKDVFVNGTEPGILRTPSGVRIGVEVCKDSSDGYLAQTKVALDLHIVLSEDGKDNIQRNCSKRLILASRAGGHSGVYEPWGQLSTSTGDAPTRMEKVEGFPLRYYNVAV